MAFFSIFGWEGGGASEDAWPKLSLSHKESSFSEKSNKIALACVISGWLRAPIFLKKRRVKPPFVIREEDFSRHPLRNGAQSQRYESPYISPSPPSPLPPPPSISGRESQYGDSTICYTKTYGNNLFHRQTHLIKNLLFSIFNQFWAFLSYICGDFWETEGRGNLFPPLSVSSCGGNFCQRPLKSPPKPPHLHSQSTC